MPVPQDGGNGKEGDPLAELKSDLRTARGRALLLETAAAGWGEGRASAPQRDWRPERLGPAPPDAMEKIRDGAFLHVLAACGAPASLFSTDDGTAQREAFRRYLTTTVQPLARLLEHELSSKLEGEVKLDFSALYAHDLAGRATAFSKLIAGGLPVNEALVTSGLMADE